MIPDPELNIWEHSANVRDLYARRALGEDEMDAAVQCVEILAPYLKPGMSLLDAGCGSGYYYRSFQRRKIDVDYYGIDYSPTLINIGHDNTLLGDRLRVMAIEDISDTYDVVICFNTLSWCADFRRPLERLCQAAQKYILIRTNLGTRTVYRWEEDGYLDRGYNHLKAYWNQYSESEMKAFMEDLGFDVRPIVDSRTNGRVEQVVGKPYHWKLLFGRRR